MLQRLYVNNFRCLDNFELTMKTMSSALLVGKNGTGKSTISHVLEIFQSIGRGINRIGHLVTEKDFSYGRTDVPIRVEIEVILKNQHYQYTLALELPNAFNELRVLEEHLQVNDNIVYSRLEAQVTLQKAQFLIDWHLIALPLIQGKSETDPLQIFRTWLAHMLILAPIPSLMTGISQGETLKPNRDASNFAEWFSGLLSLYPASYTRVDNYLKQLMPDIKDFQNEILSKNNKKMRVRFEANQAIFNIDFNELSDGEKCFFLCAVVLAANESYGALFCFWDEPDNYLSLSEISYFINVLRRAFKQDGQILMTSHNEETVRKFPDENIFLLTRKSHLEPTIIRQFSELNFQGDILTSLICGDL